MYLNPLPCRELYQENGHPVISPAFLEFRWQLLRPSKHGETGAPINLGPESRLICRDFGGLSMRGEVSLRPCPYCVDHGRAYLRWSCHGTHDLCVDSL